MRIPDEQSKTAEAKAWDKELVRRSEEIRSGKAIGKQAKQLFDELRRQSAWASDHQQ
jgi:hypothetical protein